MVLERWVVLDMVFHLSFIWVSPENEDKRETVESDNEYPLNSTRKIGEA